MTEWEDGYYSVTMNVLPLMKVRDKGPLATATCSLSEQALLLPKIRSYLAEFPRVHYSQTPWISHPGAPVSVLGTILNLTCIYISQDPGIEGLPIQESVKFHQLYVITTLHRFIITYTQASVLPLSRTNIHSKTFKVTEY